MKNRKQLYFIERTKFLIYRTYLNCQLPNSCMHSFYNGGLPNQFDNYFTEFTSVHKHETGLASLQKYHLTRMKTNLG